ncbi:MAG: bifunctional hydroxymethylpyrimidine kinase/phosphomethylpyrimidine kinase [Oscillospiraceae bacterium]|nr:bifunctional hydroxymethylpyrimidine kinase/phosphomethylpyrimidine kinase [Oscillospiraceae bacterium]
MKTVLSIAGSDSSGGAGIQADIKTIIMNGVYAMTAVTALTAQNTMGVRSVQEVSPEFMKMQLDCVFEDIFPDAVKIGMTSSPELIEAIGERLSFYKPENIVCDPVMISTSGCRLIREEAADAVKKHLFPKSRLITPNIPEAEFLSGFSISDRTAMEKTASFLGKEYSTNVLLKGGHNLEDSSDVLYESESGRITWFEGRRIPNENNHGTGCTLSSAIAANLAKGYSLKDSIRRGKEYVTCALEYYLNLGHGKGPLNHCFDLKGYFAE